MEIQDGSSRIGFGGLENARDVTSVAPWNGNRLLPASLPTLAPSRSIARTLVTVRLKRSKSVNGGAGSPGRDANAKYSTEGGSRRYGDVNRVTPSQSCYTAREKTNRAKPATRKAE